MRQADPITEVASGLARGALVPGDQAVRAPKVAVMVAVSVAGVTVVVPAGTPGRAEMIARNVLTRALRKRHVAVADRSRPDPIRPDPVEAVPVPGDLSGIPAVRRIPAGDPSAVGPPMPGEARTADGLLVATSRQGRMEGHTAVESTLRRLRQDLVRRRTGKGRPRLERAKQRR